MDIKENLKVIVFDFDGTLHSLDVDWHSLKRSIGLVDTGESLGKAINRFKIERNDKMLQVITNHELAAIEGKSLSKDIVSTLKQLSSNYEIAIFSRNSRKSIEKILEASNLGDIYIVAREDTDRIKPHPSGLKKILDHFNSLPNEVLLVGDTNHDVLVASAAKVKCAIVGDNYNDVKGTQPYYFINSIKELVPLLDKEDR